VEQIDHDLLFLPAGFEIEFAVYLRAR